MGLDGRETPRSVSFCDCAIRNDSVLVVEDAAADPRFADGPLVLGAPFIRSFAGAPLIVPSGERIGTLSAVDRVPRRHTDEELATLADLAALVVELLEKRLSEREQQIFQRVSEIAPSGWYVCDHRSAQLTWSSRGLAPLLGVPPGTVTGEALLAGVHPDDRALFDRRELTNAEVAGGPRLQNENGKSSGTMSEWLSPERRRACSRALPPGRRLSVRYENHSIAVAPSRGMPTPDELRSSPLPSSALRASREGSAPRQDTVCLPGVAPTRSTRGGCMLRDYRPPVLADAPRAEHAPP